MFCEHQFNQSVHSHYLQCEKCLSFYRPNSDDPNQYLNNYWSPARQHSTLREQIYNIDTYQENGFTKNEALLKWVKSGERCLEIACAPGITLKKLKPLFKERHGVEPDPEYQKEIEEISEGATIHSAYFPNVKFEENYFDTIIGMDIFEHIEDGQGFLVEMLKILKPSGQIILMLPLNDAPERMFCPEHIWLYSKTWLKNVFEGLFQRVYFDKWLPGHDLVIGELKQKA